MPAIHEAALRAMEDLAGLVFDPDLFGRFLALTEVATARPDRRHAAATVAA